MKKILAIGLGLVTTFGASAQNWTPQNFMADGIAALVISNSTTTGGKGVTNLFSTTSQGGLGPGTNVANTSWVQQLSDFGSNSLQSTIVAILPNWLTNGLYTNYVTGALDVTTNTLSTKSLLDPVVPLWISRDGNPIFMNPPSTGTNCFASILIRTVGGVALTSTNQVTFVFEGVPYCDKSGNCIGTTATGDRFVVATVVSNGITPAVLVTNIPAYKFLGYKGIRCASISTVNGDNNAGNQIYVTDLRLIGFVP